MRCRKMWILGAALCGVLLCGGNSQAGSISYLASGTFTSSGTPTFSDGISSVDYTSASSSRSSTPSNVSLGFFTTTGEHAGHSQ